MKTLLILLTPFIIFIIFISTNTQAEFYVEADPFACGLNGHSLHLGIQGGGYRMQVGMFKAEAPDAFKDNKNFNVVQAGHGIKIDYYGTSPDGAFIGLEYGQTKAKYQLKTGGEVVEQDVNLLGFRLGYKITLSNNLFITPWVGLDKNISKITNITVSGETYTPDEWIIFPTVHLGYEF